MKTWTPQHKHAREGMHAYMYTHHTHAHTHVHTCTYTHTKKTMHAGMHSHTFMQGLLRASRQQASRLHPSDCWRGCTSCCGAGWVSRENELAHAPAWRACHVGRHQPACALPNQLAACSQRLHAYGRNSLLFALDTEPNLRVCLLPAPNNHRPAATTTQGSNGSCATHGAQTGRMPATSTCRTMSPPALGFLIPQTHLS
jgi:hypothetical protein